MKNLGNGFERLVIIMAAVFFACTINTTALADDAQTREELYAELLTEELSRQPAGRSRVDDLETDPDFLRRWSAALHAFESSRVGPIQTSGDRTGQGACPKLPCGPLIDPIEFNVRSGSAVQSIRVTNFNPDDDAVLVTWDPPQHALAAGPDSVEYYEVLVVDNFQYQVYRLGGFQTFGAPRRNRGLHVKQEYGTGLPGETVADQTTHRDRRWAQQYFRLALAGHQQPSIYVRPIYAASEEASGRDQLVSLKPGSTPTNTGATSVGPFSAPLQINASGTQSLNTTRPGGTPLSPLQQCVAAAVKAGGGLAQLQSLDCSNRGIVSLAGIEQLVNLQTLTLDDNPLSDITPLSQLTNLRSLSLGFTNVHSLDALQSLVNLESLVISNAQVTSLMPLANLNQLQSVSAQNNQIDYIPDLSATSIQSLYLAGNLITDVSGVRAALLLQELRLNDNNVGDLDPVIDNAEQVGSSLQVVDLQGNTALYCPQLTVLGNLIGVASSEYSGPGLFSPSTCQQIPAPDNLLVSSNPVVGFNFTLSWHMPDGNASTYSYEVERENAAGTESQLDTTPQGQSNFVNTQPISIGTHDYRVRACVGVGSGTDCGGWSQDLELSILADPDDPIGDVLIYSHDDNLNTCIEQALVGVQTHGQLTYLNCAGRQIQSLDGLAFFPNLNTLIADYNQIDDIESIQHLQALNVLQLSHNSLGNEQLRYIAMGGSQTYATLNISNNQLSDLSLLEEPAQNQPGLSYVQRLTVDYNSLASIDVLSNISVLRLSATNNFITRVPKLNNIEFLALSHNDLSVLDGFCTPDEMDPSCLPNQAMAGTLRHLTLDNNPLLQNPNELAKLSNLSVLLTISLAANSIITLDFAAGWDSISYVDISHTPISDLSGLSNKTSLSDIIISGSSVTDFTSLVNVPFLSLIRAEGSRSLTSLEGLQEFSYLTILQLSDTGIDPINGLDPISEMNPDNLSFELYLDSNDVFNIMPIIESTYGIRTDLYRLFNLTGEDQINCGQFIAAENGPYGYWTFLPQSCMPSIPSFNRAKWFSNTQEISLSWSPAVEGVGLVQGSVSHYVIRFDRVDELGDSLPDWPQEVSTLRYGTHLDWDASSLSHDDRILVSIKSCRAVGECSPFSEPVAPVGSVQVPATEITVWNDDTAALDLTYSAPLPAGQSPIEFELRPIFPVDLPAVISQPMSPGLVTTLDIPYVSRYPGLLAILQACQDQPDSERICSEDVLVNFREINVTTQVDPVSSVTFAPNVSAPGAVLSWDHSDSNAYFRVREQVGQSDKANYIIAEKKFTVQRFDRAESTPEYHIYACVQDAEGEETCSESRHVSGFKDIMPTFSKPVSPTEVTAGQPNNICWFEQPGYSPYDFVKLRWSYDWKEGRAPGDQVDTPSHFRAGRCNTFGTPCGLSNPQEVPFSEARSYMVETLPGSGHYEQKWYWESGLLNSSYTSGSSQVPHEFAIDPGIFNRSASFGDQTDTIRALLNVNGNLEINTETRCADLPQQAGRSPTDVAGGPDDLRPGHWYTDEQPRQGWRFFWANELRLDDQHEAFGVAYDLIGFWYTYKIIEGQWSPVWYYTRMEVVEDENETGGYFFEGALHYPQKLSKDLQVGTVQVYLSDSLPNGLNDNQHAYIRLDVNHGDGQVVGDQIFEIKDFSTYYDSQLDPGQEGPFGGDNPASRWNGVWTEGPLFKLVEGHLGINDMFLTEWISGGSFSSAVHFFDQSDEPIWLMKFESDCNVTQFPNGCDDGSFPDYSRYHYQEKMNVPFPGFNPFWDGSDHVFDDGYMDHINNFVNENTGLGRKYELTNPIHELDDLHGKYCSTVSITLKNKDENGEQVGPNHRAASLITGGSCRDGQSQDADTVLRKVASLHYFGYEIIGSDQCDLNLGACELELTWFTDDYYPDALPVFRDYPGGNQRIRTLSEVCENEIDQTSWDYAVYGQKCVIGEGIQSGRFLLMGDASANAPELAISREFTSSLATVVPTPDDPLGPIDDPNHTVTDASSSIGATRGNFRVTETGAATYSIPIMTMPGSGGVAPNMSLQYHSEGGSGALGRGWSVGGLSTITRCGQTLEAGEGDPTGIQFNNSDRFCLDGQRLIRTSGLFYGAPGSTYRTEIDHLALITAYDNDGVGGPDFFEVKRKDGSITTYGANTSTDPSAKIQVPGSEAVFAWPVSRIEDSAGNYMEFVYLQPDPLNAVEWHPLHVHYTGHAGRIGYPGHAPYAQISFNYVDLSASQKTFSYVAGAKAIKTKRLDSVDSLGESLQHIRHYRLAYSPDNFGRDLLHGVQECWDDQSINHCFEPTTFEWNKALLRPTYPLATNGVTLSGFKGGRLADVNSDGLQDYLFLSKSGSSLRFRHSIASVNSSGTIQYGAERSGPFLQSGVDPDDPPTWVLADINLDGFNDIIYIVDDVLYAHNWQELSSSFGQSYQLQQISQTIDPDRLHAADWNGNGRVDILIGHQGTIQDPITCFEMGPLFLENSSENGTVNFEFAAEMLIDFDLEGPYSYLAGLDVDSSLCGNRAVAIRPNVSIAEGLAGDFDGDGKVEFIGVVSGAHACDDSGNCGSFSFYALLEERPVVNIFGDTELVVTEFIGHYYESDIGTENIDFITTADVNGDGISDILYVDRSDRWFLRIGNSDGFNPPVRQFNLNSMRHEEADKLQFAPIAGDGTLDLIGIERISGDDRIRHFRWNWDLPGWEASTQTSPNAGNLNENIRSFQDITGNGVVDTLRVWYDDGEDWLLTAAPGNISSSSVSPGLYGYTGWFRIHTITDGFGAWTELKYQSLVQPSVYARGTGGESLQYGLCPDGQCSAIYDITYPSFVVSSATSLSPQYNSLTPSSVSGYDPAGQTRVDYYYSGARIQGGGRGFLGFSEVASYDPQSLMLTRTRYRQDFPFIGSPKATRSWYLNSSPFGAGNAAPTLPDWEDPSTCENPVSPGNDAILMGCSENTWTQRTTSAGRPHPYLQSSEEWSYVPDVSGSTVSGSTFTHRVLTENIAVDQFGNIEELRVTTFTSPSGTGSEFSSQHTVNTYVNHNDNRWHLGRLTCATVESSRSDVPDGYLDSVTRISTFGYDDETGILDRETAAASAALGCGDTSGALTTAYVLGPFGNRERTTVTDGSTGEMRITEAIYDTRGRFVDKEEVLTPSGMRWTQRVDSRDRYGNPLQVTGGNGVSAWQYYDHMGRPFYTYSSDGAWSKTTYSTDASRCPHPDETALVEIHSTADRSKQYVCKDVLGREVRTSTQGFTAGQWINIDTHYDYAARPIAVSEPYVDISQSSTYCNDHDDATCLNSSQAHWAETFYDEFGRVMQIRLPNGRLDAIEYEGLLTTTVHGVGELGTQRNQTERNVLGETIYERHWPDGNNQPAAKTAFGYDALGQLVTTDGPLPGIDVDEIKIVYNPLGQKIEVVDPDKGTWNYVHNAFGDLLCQQDAEGNSIASAYDVLGRQIRRYDWSNGSCNAAEGLTGFSSKTTWTYSDQQPSSAFGQMTAEETVNASVAASGSLPFLPQTSLTRDYDHDPLGRVWRVRTSINDGIGTQPYVQETVYDKYGRVFQQFDATGDDRGERLVYNNQGYLQSVYDARFPADGATPYREVEAMNARGQVLNATLGNGTSIRRFFDPATGLPTLAAETLTSTNELALFYDYAWDVFNRLQNRTDLAAGFYDERYGYDHINRLTDYWVTGDDGIERLQQQLRYDHSGNILCKSDVAGESDCNRPDTYQYGANGAGPHAVTEVEIAGGYRTFTYDANGNMTRDERTASGNTRLQRRFEYTPFNKLRRVTQEDGMNRSSDFHYGPDRSRFLQRKMEGGSVVSRTHYIGNVEIEYDASNFFNAQQRRNIGGIALEDLDIDGRGKLRYQHRDHLGSIVALSTSGGRLHARMGFDPWGQRRDPENIQAPWLQWVAHGASADATFATPHWAWLMIEATPRGYTGHEHLDWHGLIHMNGRIYDPHLARFLQADPFMEDTGTLNRYSYVLNNPLIYTDPSGYLFDSFKDFFKTVVSIAISIAAPYVMPGIWGAIVAGAVSGAVMTGSVEGALWGAFSGAIFYGIGDYFGDIAGAEGTGFWGTGLDPGEFAAQAVSHGIAGGVIAEMQGGKFGHGFLSAGVSKLATPGIMAKIDDTIAQGVAVAIVGGTVSEATGGKFANGAVTSAMAFAFNQVATSQSASQQSEGDIVVGFDGAGSDDLRDNQMIQGLGGELNAKMFDARAVVGAPVGEARDYILAQLEMNPSAKVYIFGYSAGGHAAISLAGALHGHGVPVQGLVTFDPHSPRSLFGSRSYRLPSNVARSVNFYQSRSNLFSGSNPFAGGTVSCSGCAFNPNVNLTGAAVHTNIVRYSMRSYRSEIYSSLGH